MKIEYEFDFDFLNGFYIKINDKTNYYDIMEILNIPYTHYNNLLTQFNAKYKSFYGNEGYFFDQEKDCKNFVEMIERIFNSNKKENTSQNTKTSKFKIGDKVRVTNPRPEYGLDNVKVGDIGEIVKLSYNKDYYKINFPHREHWNAVDGDLTIVEEETQRKLGEMTWCELNAQMKKDYPNYINSSHAEYKKPKFYEEKIGKNRKIKIIEKE